MIVEDRWKKGKGQKGKREKKWPPRTIITPPLPSTECTIRISLWLRTLINGGSPLHAPSPSTTSIHASSPPNPPCQSAIALVTASGSPLMRAGHRSRKRKSEGYRYNGRQGRDAAGTLFHPADAGVPSGDGASACHHLLPQRCLLLLLPLGQAPHPPTPSRPHLESRPAGRWPSSSASSELHAIPACQAPLQTPGSMDTVISPLGQGCIFRAK